MSDQPPKSPKPRPHLIDGEFQSDKYPTCPRGKVPLSTKDPTAQDLLWQYAQRRRGVDHEFAEDLETALRLKGFKPWQDRPTPEDDAIDAAHPLKTGRHDLYAEAMRLVGDRHSKYRLVDLVNWLLSRISNQAQATPAPSEADHECG